MAVPAVREVVTITITSRRMSKAVNILRLDSSAAASILKDTADRIGDLLDDLLDDGKPHKSFGA